MPDNHADSGESVRPSTPFGSTESASAPDRGPSSRAEPDMGHGSQPRDWTTLVPLLQESLTREGSLHLTLRGDSMLPTLPQICEIEVAALQSVQPIGSLIVFARPQGLVAHRLVSRTTASWVMQGDGRLRADDPVAPSQVLGRVIAAYSGEVRCWPGSRERILAAWWVTRYFALRAAHTIRRIMTVKVRNRRQI